MSVRRFVPENRLAKALGDRDGIKFEQALLQATRNVELARASYETALDEKLTQLGPTLAAAMADKGARPRLYRLAQDVCADAGQLGYRELAEAAKSLCDLLASSQEGARFWAAVGVHRDAFAVLRNISGSANPALSGEVLKGLKCLSAA